MSDTGLGTNQLKTQGWELIINGTRGGETQDTENTGLTTIKYWTVLVPKTQLNTIYLYLIVIEIVVN